MIICFSIIASLISLGLGLTSIWITIKFININRIVIFRKINKELYNLREVFKKIESNTVPTSTLDKDMKISNINFSYYTKHNMPEFSEQFSIENNKFNKYAKEYTNCIYQIRDYIIEIFGKENSKPQVAKFNHSSAIKLKEQIQISVNDLDKFLLENNITGFAEMYKSNRRYSLKYNKKYLFFIIGFSYILT